LTPLMVMAARLAHDGFGCDRGARTCFFSGRISKPHWRSVKFAVKIRPVEIG
jgi:hypothetical protein